MRDTTVSEDFLITDGLLRKYNGGKTNIVIPDGVTGISECAFRGMKYIRSVTFPGRLESIGKKCFEGCTGLESISIPDSVRTIGEYAFSGCNGIRRIHLSGGLNLIETCVFSGCSSLREIRIPDGVRTIKSGAFSYCTSLEMAYIPRNTGNLQDVSGLHPFKGSEKVIIYTPKNSVAELFARAHAIPFVNVQHEPGVSIRFGPTVQLEPLKELEAALVPSRSPAQEIRPAPVKKPEPVPAPAPKPEPVPAPISRPEPAPRPEPVSRPEPAPAPAAVKKPEVRVSSPSQPVKPAPEPARPAAAAVPAQQYEPAKPAAPDRKALKAERKKKQLEEKKRRIEMQEQLRIEKERERAEAAERRRAEAEERKRAEAERKREEAERKRAEAERRQAEIKAEKTKEPGGVSSRKVAVMILIAFLIGTAIMFAAMQIAEKRNINHAEYTLEEFVEVNPDARLQIQQSVEGTNVSVYVSSNELIYKYDLSQTEGMTEEAAKDSEVIEALEDTLDSGDNRFIELCQSLENDTGIKGITVKVLYTFGDEKLISRTYTANGKY